MSSLRILHLVDFDGTLTDNRHRRSLREADPAAYLKARHDDTPSDLLLRYTSKVFPGLESILKAHLLPKNDAEGIDAHVHRRTIVTDRPVVAFQETRDFLVKHMRETNAWESFSFRSTPLPSLDEKVGRILALANVVIVGVPVHVVVVVDDDTRVIEAVQQAAREGRFLPHVVTVHARVTMSAQPLEWEFIPRPEIPPDPHWT